jgi:hypothetical protein
MRERAERGIITQQEVRMEPPFPGMDPYLERSSLWPDVHIGLITAIRDYLQARIAPGYIAQITPYVALEQIEIAAPRRALVPDVGVYERDPAAVAVLPAAVDAPSLTGAALLDVPTRYARVELRAVADETLVTAIELLSPANKRPTPDGADAYEQKRQDLFRSGVHLLEIDLLRGGRRPRLARPDPLPPRPTSSSSVAPNAGPPSISGSARSTDRCLPCLCRCAAPTRIRRCRSPSLLHQVYRNARYDLRIDYRQPPPPPDLTPDEAAWLDAHLRACGLRP